jgi:hypothetical protein
MLKYGIHVNKKIPEMGTHGFDLPIISIKTIWHKDFPGSFGGCLIQRFEQHGPLMACIKNGSRRDSSGNLTK